MLREYRKTNHAVYDIKYHIVLTTRYRYKVLKGSVSRRLQKLILQGCKARNITIISINIRSGHINLLISCPPNLAPSKILQYLKVRSSRLLQDEFPKLKSKYWGQNLWACGYFCATVGNVAEETIKTYIETQDISGSNMFIVEE